MLYLDTISRNVIYLLYNLFICDVHENNLFQIKEFVKNNYKENEDLVEYVQEEIDRRLNRLLGIYYKFIKTL